MRKVPINPRLPARFDETPNESRPRSHMRWWNRPYIVTTSWEQMCWPTATEEDRTRWFRRWPSGTRYDVRCLDGGAWDRSTCWGMYATLEEALEVAGGESPHRKRK
jgi:hypothetical protein